MTNSLKMKMLYVTLGTMLAASSASAKMYVNSMCTMKADSAGKIIEGDDKKDKRFPLASISKIVTALWAIEKLGPDYRYPTKLHVTKAGAGGDTYDIHIEGSRDPIFGRNASYFLISELNKQNIDIKKVENLTFDENFLLDWLSEESPRVAGDTPYYDTLEKQTTAVRNSLVNDFSSALRKEMYNKLKAKAAKIGVTMEANPSISVRRVEFQPKASFKPTPETKVYTYQSAPLHTILKRMNNQSNNYIADHLYWNLGGTDAFNKYVKEALSVGKDEIEFYLGSGNNANYILDPNKNIYNEATCETMIKVMYRMDTLLAKKGYKLSHVMAVAGMDDASTVASYGGNFLDTTVAKTGSVNKAKTLAGTVSTKNGTIYFAVLMHTDGRADWGAASATIKSKVNKLIVDNGGPQRIHYAELLPLPFDKRSALQLSSVMATHKP